MSYLELSTILCTGCQQSPIFLRKHILCKQLRSPTSLDLYNYDFVLSNSEHRKAYTVRTEIEYVIRDKHNFAQATAQSTMPTP